MNIAVFLSIKDMDRLQFPPSGKMLIEKKQSHKSDIGHKEIDRILRGLVAVWFHPQVVR